MHPSEYAMVAQGSFRALLTKSETAKRLRVSERHLDRLHELGQGPPRVQLGARRVAYSDDALIAWVAERTSAAKAAA